MGLWEYCFDQFRYPYYQFDKKFNGCHHIFSQEYYVIREWLLPVWLMFVQAFVTIALLLSCFAFTVISLIWIRWPLKFVLSYEWVLSSIAFLCNAVACKKILNLKSEEIKLRSKHFFNFRWTSFLGCSHIWWTVLAS